MKCRHCQRVLLPRADADGTHWWKGVGQQVGQKWCGGSAIAIGATKHVAVMDPRDVRRWLDDYREPVNPV